MLRDSGAPNPPVTALSVPRLSKSQVQTLRTLAKLDEWVSTSNQHGAAYVPIGSVFALEKLALVEVQADRGLRYSARITERGRAVLAHLPNSVLAVG